MNADYSPKQIDEIIAATTIPETIHSFPAPDDGTIDAVCKWLLIHKQQPDSVYDYDQAIHDAHVIAYLDSAMVAGWMEPIDNLQLIGVDIKDYLYEFK